MNDNNMLVLIDEISGYFVNKYRYLDSDDVVGIVAEGACIASKEYDPLQAGLKTYTCSIVENLLNQEARDSKQEELIKKKLRTLAKHQDIYDEDVESIVVDRIDTQEKLELINCVVENILTEKSKQVYHLYFECEYPLSRIAKELGVSYRTAQSRVNRMIEHIKRGVAYEQAKRKKGQYEKRGINLRR